MTDSDDGPTGPQATAELLTHIFQKGFQAGCLIGLGVILPAVALRRRSAGISLITNEFQKTGAKVMTYSAALGMVTTGTARHCASAVLYWPDPGRLHNLSRPCTGIMGLGMIYGKPLEAEGIEDRAYRLRHNEGQIRTDGFAQVSMVLSH